MCLSKPVSQCQRAHLTLLVCEECSCSDRRHTTQRTTGPSGRKHIQEQMPFKDKTTQNSTAIGWSGRPKLGFSPEMLIGGES
jgi:hypothetical protein